MKKLKCTKCKIYFKDRQDPEDKEAEKTLCWQCRFIWKCIGLTLMAIGNQLKGSRTITINLEDVKIEKSKKSVGISVGLDKLD